MIYFIFNYKRDRFLHYHKRTKSLSWRLLSINNNTLKKQNILFGLWISDIKIFYNYVDNPSASPFYNIDLYRSIIDMCEKEGNYLWWVPDSGNSNLIIPDFMKALKL